MKTNYTLIFAFCLFLSFTGSAAPAWEADFIRIEKDYNKGDYKISLRRTKQVIIKIQARKSGESIALGRAYFHMAKSYEALGKFDEYKKYMALGMNNLQVAEKKDIMEYSIALKEAIDAYIQYGDFYNADITLKKAFDLVETGELTDKGMIDQFRVRQTTIYYHQGFLLKADKLITEIIDFKKTRIVKKEMRQDPKREQVLEMKVPKDELLQRKRELAEFLNFYSRIKIENGDYKGADSLIQKNATWIRKNIRTKDISYAENQFLRGILYELNNDKLHANDRLSKAVKIAGKSKGIKYKPVHKNMITYYEKLIPSHRSVGRKRKATKKNNQLDARIIRYFGRSSIYYGRALIIEAETYFKFNDFVRAEQKLTYALEHPEMLPAGHLQRARALSILYSIYIKLDKYEKAEKCLDEIASIRKELMGESTPSYHMAKLDLANYHVMHSNKFKEAEGIYNLSLRKVVDTEIDHKHKDYISYLYQESKLYEYTDRYEKAKEILERAEEEVKKKWGEKHIRYGVALERLANIDIHLGRYADAEKKLNASLEIFKSNSNVLDNIDYAHSLETFARLYIILGEYEEAERTLKKAYRITKRSEEDVKTSSAIEEIATLNIALGRYQQTEKSLRENMKLKEARYGPSHRSLINPLNQLGHLALITGDYTEAEKLLKRAASISIKIYGENSVKYAESLRLMHTIYSSIGDYEKAEEAAGKVVSIQTAQYGRNHILVANSLNDLALVKHYNNRKKTEIEDLFMESLKIIRENLSEDHPQYAEVLKNLSLFYMETGKLDQAESQLVRANQVWVKKLGPANIHSAEIAFMHGNIAYKKQNFTAARDKFTEAKNMYAKLFDVNHPHYVKALSKAGQMQYILGDYKGAVKSYNETTENYLTFIRKYFPSLSEREKNKLWNLMKSDFEFYNTLAYKLKNENPELVGNVYNFSLSTKALLLSSSIKVKERIMNSKDENLIRKYEAWVGKKELMTTAISMSAEQRKSNEIDIKQLEKDLEALEKELSESSELFAQNYEKKITYDWKEVKKRLSDNEYAVEIIRFRLFTKNFSDTIIYAALVLHSSMKSGPEMVLLPDGKELESKYLKYFRNCIKFNVEDQYSYDKFWKPLQSIIKENSRVYLSGDGVYNQINLEAMAGPDKKYLIEKNEIVLVSNTKDIIVRAIEKEKEAKAKQKAPAVSQNNVIMLFGNPTYYEAVGTGTTRKIVPLPGAEKEVLHLNELMVKNGWKAEVFLSDDATEARIKELKDPKVFHIATHGFFLEDIKTDAVSDMGGINENRGLQNPLLRSGLLLRNGGHLMESGNVYEFNSTDGVLTAYEAMNLNLDNTELVVLSACETGMGELQLGEGVYGLQRAFLVAGANSVIMTLFKVSDEVTKELMEIFYKKWVATGNKRKSFIEAKKEIKDKYQKPIYWGAFIMVGLD